MRGVLFTVLLGFSIILFMQGCTKSPTETVVPGPVDDTTWAAVDTLPKITDSLDKPLVVDSFNCASDHNNANVISLGDSVFINFPVGGCMTTANDPSTIIKKSTKIKAEIRFLATKGDLLRFHLSTISNINTNSYLIAIGNFINIKLKYNGKEVFWNPFSAPIQVKVKAANTTQLMTYFSFQPIGANGKDSTWSSSFASTTFGYVMPYKDSQKRNWYQIFSNRTRLFGCAYYLDKNNSLPKTRLNVFMPLRYTNKNTLVYAAFDNYKSVVRLHANPVGKSYGVAGIPINAKVTIVTISKIRGIYYLGNSSVAVTDSKPFIVIPNQTDKQSLNDYLRNL